MKRHLFVFFGLLLGVLGPHWMVGAVVFGVDDRRSVDVSQALQVNIKMTGRGQIFMPL